MNAPSPLHRVPGVHLDGTLAFTAVTTSRHKCHILLGFSGTKPMVLRLTVDEADKLAAILREGRSETLCSASQPWTLSVAPSSTSTDATPDTMMLLATDVGPTASRCAGGGAIAIIHARAQITELADFLSDVTVRLDTSTDP
jgi:hypothetical protein